MALSAGVLHCWFVLHKLAMAVVNHKCLFQASLMSMINMSGNTCKLCVVQDAKLIWLPMQAGLQCIMVCMPVLLFQFSGWLSFCHKGSVERPWCSSALPNIYSFVQSHYWGVGLLRYFKFQQVILLRRLALSFACSWAHTNAIPMPHIYLTTGSHCLLLLSSLHPIIAHADTNFVLAMPMLLCCK